MGLSYFVTVVYGIRETKAMAKARKKTRMVERPVCPKGHKVDRWNPPAFCASCGSQISKQEVQEPFTEHAVQTYAAKGRDPENSDTDHDYMANTWIHEGSPNDDGGGVVIGIKLLHKWSREDTGVFPIVEPTHAQKKEFEAYLCDMGVDILGMGEGIQTHLVVGCM